MEEALLHMEKIRSEVPPSDELADIDRDGVGDFGILAGIFLIASGVRQRGKELWQQEYQEFYAVVVSGIPKI